MTAMRWPQVGSTFGRRVVIDAGIIRLDPSGRERPCVMLRCACGAEDLVPVSAAKKSDSCPRCANKGRVWTAAERAAHSERIKAATAKRKARERAADLKAVRKAKARRRRKILASEGG